MKSDDRSEFERIATEAPPGIVSEFWDFLRHNKKWWLIPIIIALLAAGTLLFIASTGLGPFIYPLL